jgi:hypothetical protein
MVINKSKDHLFAIILVKANKHKLAELTEALVRMEAIMDFY